MIKGEATTLRSESAEPRLVDANYSHGTHPGGQAEETQEGQTRTLERTYGVGLMLTGRPPGLPKLMALAMVCGLPERRANDGDVAVASAEKSDLRRAFEGGVENECANGANPTYGSVQD